MTFICKLQFHTMLFFALLGGSTPTFAVDTTWDGSTDNNWSDASNWDTNAVPTSADITTIDLGTAEILSGITAFSSIGRIGYWANTNGHVTVSGAGSSWDTNSLVVGQLGTGSLSVAAGGLVSNSGAYVNGSVAVYGSGSRWSTTFNLFIADGGTGSLNVTDSGTVTNDVGYVGHIAGSNGSALVHGSGSSWTSDSTLTIGAAGTGQLNIQRGGVVNNIDGFIGANKSGEGGVTVDGSGSLWANSGNLSVGAAGLGSLGVTAGGQVTNVDGVIGTYAGGQGDVEVQGAGSRWTNSGTLTVGESGLGSLVILSGGRVSNTVGTIGANAGSNGNVSVIGATWTNSDELIVGRSGAGDLDITAGAYVSNTIGTIGYYAGSNGSVEVSGVGSHWTNTDWYTVIGRSGTGDLSITAGGTVRNTYGLSKIGAGVGSIGRVTVDGSGSKFISNVSTDIGEYGTGSLDVTAGGFAELGWLGLGSYAGSEGRLTVNGGSSRLQIYGPMGVGFLGTASFEVTGGAQVESHAAYIIYPDFPVVPNVYIGERPGSNGSVTVSGAGSRWYLYDTWIPWPAPIPWEFYGGPSINLYSTGSLAVTAGGNVNTSATTLQSEDSSVTVDGAGSHLINRRGLSVSGSLSVSNGGKVSVGGSNSATVAGASANVNIGVGGAPGILNVATINGGAGTPTLNFNHTDTDYYFTRNGTSAGTPVNIAGSLAVNHIGSGTTILTGNNTYSGGTMITAGTLQIGNGGTIGSIVGNVTNNGTLSFNRSDTLTFDGVTSGTGSVAQDGTGTTILTGNNTYTGATTVNNGILYVNGSSSASTHTVNVGGTLGGTGTVGSVIVNGGSFAPGNSIGTINVAGNVDFSGGGLYQVEVDAAGNTDLINATGSATLTNGAVQVLAEAGTYNYSTDYTILTAAGGLGGTTFNSVTSNLAFLDPTLTYDANNVYLNLTRNDVALTSSAIVTTTNQFSVSSALQQLSTTNPAAVADILNNLLLLTNKGVQQAYNSLSGVQHGSVPGISNNLTQRFLALVRSHGFSHLPGSALSSLDPMTGPLLASTENDLGVGSVLAAASRSAASAPTLVSDQGRYWWLQGFTGEGDSDNARYQHTGLAAGVDFPINDRWTVGLAASLMNADVGTDSSDADIDSYQLAVYGNWHSDDWYADLVAAYARHDTDSARTVVIGNNVSVAAADYDSDTYSLSAEVGKQYPLANGVNVTPFAGINYAQTDRDDFTETGSIANLMVNDKTQESIQGKVGVKVSKTYQTRQGTRYTPSASIAYARQLGDDDNVMSVAFSSAPGTSFVIEGNDSERDRLQLQLGVTGEVKDNVSLHLGYFGEYAGSGDYHSLNATLRVRWD